MLRTFLPFSLMLMAAPSTSAAPVNSVEFLSMEYRGSNPDEDARPLADDEYRNPILPGFQPDPSIIRVGKDFYVVNSSFGWIPGLPIYHSRDLVNWTQIGNAIPESADFKIPAVGINRGIFAPTIRWHKGLFYIITTCIDCEGNFIITAKNPRGPWSKPIWLDTVTGIDPDLFFDTDGRVWITNNDEPQGPAQYEGHRALWLQEYDPAQGKVIGPRTVLVDRGVKPEEKPIWSEGPHIFKKDGWYYLTAAEGGTSDDHRQTIYRSKKVEGPYTPGPNNPILTQRDLDPARALPVYATGHADFVKLPGDRWWAVFLATRPYERNLTNLGRETFLLPVNWKEGWPEILPQGKAVPLRAKRPALPRARQKADYSKWVEDFNTTTLGPQWLSRKAPASDWLSLTEKPGSLVLRGTGPQFIGQRLRHRNAEISTTIAIPPAEQFGRAGLAAIADEGHQFFYGIENGPEGRRLVIAAKGLKGTAGADVVLYDKVLMPVGSNEIRLKMHIKGASADFAYADARGDWTTVLADADARLLATEYDILLFTGTVVGLYTSDLMKREGHPIPAAQK